MKIRTFYLLAKHTWDNMGSPLYSTLLKYGKTQTLDLWFIATSSSLWEGTIVKLHLRVNCLITLIYIVSKYQNENNWFLDLSILCMDNLFTLFILMNLKALESHSPTWWFSSSCFARWNYWTTWENGVISIQTSKILSRKSNILKFLISHWILYLLVDDPFYIRYWKVHALKFVCILVNRWFWFLVPLNESGPLKRNPFPFGMGGYCG